MDKSLKRVSIVFFLIGLGIFIIAVWNFVIALNFVKAAETAEGTVVENRVSYTRTSSGATRCYVFPAIAYKTAKGEQFSYVSESGSSCDEPRMNVGDTLEVIYASDNPEYAKENRFSSIWSATLVSSFVSLPFLLIGLFFVRRAFRK